MQQLSHHAGVRSSDVRMHEASQHPRGYLQKKCNNASLPTEIPRCVHTFLWQRMTLSMGWEQRKGAVARPLSARRLKPLFIGTSHADLLVYERFGRQQRARGKVKRVCRSATVRRALREGHRTLDWRKQMALLAAPA